ncbi:MAG: hypothetical protein QP780_01960 [Brevibacterium sp. UMB1308B]|nr:hypothetical protein [Brevibacterium sp. UMB1308B]
MARQIGQHRSRLWADVDVGGATSDVTTIKARTHQLEARVDGVAP